MRIDGRTLSHEMSETIRWLAVQRVKEGVAPSEVIKSYGLCRTTIYKWLTADRRGGAAGVAASVRARSRGDRGVDPGRVSAPARPRQARRRHDLLPRRGRRALRSGAGAHVGPAGADAGGPDQWPTTECERHLGGHRPRGLLVRNLHGAAERPAVRPVARGFH